MCVHDIFACVWGCLCVCSVCTEVARVDNVLCLSVSSPVCVVLTHMLGGIGGVICTHLCGRADIYIYIYVIYMYVWNIYVYIYIKLYMSI